jgi:hypothetical protein
MSYKITYTYNWYQTPVDKFIVKTYYINNIAFTFDDIPEIAKEDPEIISEANKQLIYTPEDFYKSSFYLIDEECHPCLFELDLENPEALDELL